jgi:hypothetical protein
MLKYILYAKVNVNLFAHWVILLLLLNCFYIWPPHENMASFAAVKNPKILNEIFPAEFNSRYLVMHDTSFKSTTQANIL